MHDVRLRRQRGVALITVLLVMVVAIAAVTHAITRNRIAVSRTSALLANTQLAEFVGGAESWARVMLEKDFEADREHGQTVDSATEAWAQKAVNFNPENGKIRIYISDLQSCFNVNNLTGSGAGIAKQVEIFNRLVNNVSGKTELAKAILDWLDDGDTPVAMATEDNGYLGLEVAHRTPDTMITDTSELAAVQGMEKEDWQKLRPFLCALPESGTPVNVNSASAELLEALYPQANITELVRFREADGVVEQRSQLSEFGVESSGAELSVQSNYYLAHIAVQLGLGGEYQQYWESTLQLDEGSGQARVLQRQRREFFGEHLQELLDD